MAKFRYSSDVKRLLWRQFHEVRSYDDRQCACNITLWLL